MLNMVPGTENMEAINIINNIITNLIIAIIIVTM